MKKLLLFGMAIAICWALSNYIAEKIKSADVEVTNEEKEEAEAGADKQMTMWWWSRAYPEPTNLEDKFYRGWLQALGLKHPALPTEHSRETENSRINFSGNWIAIGPDQNIGGRILSIAVDPQQPNTVFIGSASGGIWKTVNGGAGTAAWRPVMTGFPTLGVASLLIHPSNSNIIYAGTGEVYRTDTSNIGFNVWKARGTYGVGILKSINGGVTWSQVLSRSLPNLFAIQMMEFDPTNPNTIYACATDGLYRTTDAGLSWTKILNKIYVSDVSINPTNPNIIVAAVGNLQNADKGIYRSTDGGANWVKISAGLPASFQGFIRLDNVLSNPNLIIASIGRDAGSQNELFRSTDFGTSWTTLSASNHCQYQFWFAHDVAINPSNNNQLMVGGVPFYRYDVSSAGRTSIRNVHADVHDIEYDPSNSNIVYVACDGGMYKSTNGGSNFSMINGGLKAVQFYASFAVSPTNPNIMIGGLQDNGVVRYNGTSWSSVAGGDGGPSIFHPSNGNIVFASNDARRVNRSTNGGTSFNEVLSSWAFVADSRTGFMAPIAISRSNPNIVYVGSDNLHKSTTGGVSGSWNGNNYSSATNYIDARHKTAIAMAVSSLNANKLFVSTSSFAQYDNDVNSLHVNNPPNLLKSLNGGTSFVSIKNGLPDRFVMDIAVNPVMDDSVWIVLGGFGTSHVYVSGNGGASWINRGAGLPDVPHNAIVIDPNNSSIIYVGNDLGVYVSTNRGVTWQDYNYGLWDATLIMDLVATSNNKLVAATHGKGVFVSDLYLINLPFTLESFTGKNNAQFNHLKWKTGLERDLQEFQLERSDDGFNYSTIATIAASNNISGSEYDHKDMISDQRNTTTWFYRLKVIDISGQYTYSNVVVIRTQLESDLIITGMPFTSQLKFLFNSPRQENIQLRLYDFAGKMLTNQSVHVSTGVNDLKIQNLGQLPSGTYLLYVVTGSQRFTRKVIKGSSGAGGGR